ncbi:MAG: Gfo/Idh/MocA family oxidoreductase [Verrucomicrobiota bacterium]
MLKSPGYEQEEAREMAGAADRARVRHMTAFTYRFVPAMRYLSHLVNVEISGSRIVHRSCRTRIGVAAIWGGGRVKKLAGSGELGDMLSHRIDFAHLLVGPMRRLVANLKQIVPVRQDLPSDLEDWVAILAEFENGASGVLESSKLASGRNESWWSLDYVEVNGSERSFVFTTGEWNRLQTGPAGGPGLETIEIPKEFWKSPGSPRNPQEGDPLVTFRYDQSWEFISAIREQRPCKPDFHDGALAQAVMDAAVESAQSKRWIDLNAGAERAAVR